MINNSSSFSLMSLKVQDVTMPMIEKNNIIKMGYGGSHSFTIGATMVTLRATIPQVPTEVLRLLGGKI